MADFNTSLSAGKSLEYKICKLIKKKYPSAKVIEGYKKEYDIIIPEIDTTVEVKQDFKSKFTGNYLIEIEFDGKPSALSTTRATYWAIVDQEYLVWITPDILWLIIREYDKPPAKFVGDGDTKEKKAYLIPKDKILLSPYCSVVEHHITL